MTVFHFHLRLPTRLEWDAVGIPFPTLEAAFLDVCGTLPALAGDLLREGHDLARCTYLIASPEGQTLLEVPFSELRRPPVGSGSPPRAGGTAQIPHYVQRAREMAANARRTSAEARASLVRCQAASHERIQRDRDRRRNER